MSVPACPILQNDPAIPFHLFIYNAMITESGLYMDSEIFIPVNVLCVGIS